jgi:hypothetical protein
MARCHLSAQTRAFLKDRDSESGVSELLRSRQSCDPGTNNSNSAFCNPAQLQFCI